MAKYEINGDLWWYKDAEYHRGDEVEVDGDAQFIKNHVASGFLVEVGYHEKLAKAEAKAAQEQAEADAAQVERNDAEAARRVQEAQDRLNANPADTEQTRNVSSQDGPKTTRRASGK
jgi:ribosomal protein L9